MLKLLRASRVSAVCLAAACTLLGLADAALAQQPIKPVPFTPFGDGHDAVLMADLKYRVGNTNFVITVPEGFVTDFASTPRAIWAVLPPVGQYQLAAVVHDFLYWDQGCTREQADALLRVAMTESGVDRLKRDVIWEAVRTFGGTAWTNNASARAAGQPRIIPKDALQIPALVTWKDYQAQLFANGVRPQAARTPAPDYCMAPNSPNLGVPN